jgi:hypothetical protein
MKEAVHTLENFVRWERFGHGRVRERTNWSITGEGNKETLKPITIQF